MPPLLCVALHRPGDQLPRGQGLRPYGRGPFDRRSADGAVRPFRVGRDVLDRYRDRLSACGKRSEEQKSELQSLMRISYALLCLKKKITHTNTYTSNLNEQLHKYHEHYYHITQNTIQTTV